MDSAGIGRGKRSRKADSNLGRAAFRTSRIRSITRSELSTLRRPGFGDKGFPIADVVTMLQVRRCFEIPSSFALPARTRSRLRRSA